MVVIGIIGLVVALGVPLFGVLTGSKSQEAGQNLVSAAIGQARTIALNEGKFAGVLFYIDPATERTAMTVVVIQDPQSGLEDPDPYDKYKTFVGGQVYRSALVAGNGSVITGDRAIGLTSDATATFRATPTPKNVYNPGVNFSNLSNYFGNFKPTVKVYRGIMEPTNANTGTFGPLADANISRPPRNGPTGTSTSIYRRIPNAAIDTISSVIESDTGTFGNENWSVDAQTVIAPSSLAGGERQLLPLGVGVQLIVSPIETSVAGENERYVRTGVIFFDPQGKLSLDPAVLAAAGTLGKQLGLPQTAAEIATLPGGDLPAGTTADIGGLQAGVGVVVYDNAAFRQQNFSQSDWVYQPRGNNLRAINSTLLNLYRDYPSPTVAANPLAAYVLTPDVVDEKKEEIWLDQNTVPLLINRYSGALSEAQ